MVESIVAVVKSIDVLSCNIISIFFVLRPTSIPTTNPSALPTAEPSTIPSMYPSAQPSSVPSTAPTARYYCVM